MKRIFLPVNMLSISFLLLSRLQHCPLTPRQMLIGLIII